MAEESLQDNQDIFGDDPDRLADPAVGPNGSVLRSLTQNLAVDFGDSGGGFVRLTLPAALRRLQLTSDARPIRFVLGDEGQRIQGLVGQGGAPVLEIRLNNESGQYSYTFDLKGPVDDFDGDRIDLPVGIFLSDTDGNTVTGTFDLGIVDGEPAAAAEGLLEVEEGGWTLGSEAGGCNLLEDAGPGADSGEIVRFDYIDAEGNEAFAFAGERVETEHGSLTVDADGSWSFSANPDADLDGGRILDGFNYTIESGDGDKVIARKDLQIIEDGPAAPVAERPNAESVAERTIAESEAEVAEPETAAPASTDPASTDPASTDPASTDPASTDPASTDPASIDSASTDPDPGAMAESSVTLSIPLALEELNLTSSGEAVLFERSEDGRTITATTAVGAPVFVMSLTTDDDGGFSYDFDLQGPLDPPAAGSDVLADLPFGLTVVESDGARATATIHVDVVDDSSEGEAEGPIEPEDDHPISAEPAMVEPAMAAPAIDMEEAMSPSFPPELSGMQEDTADEPLADEPLADEPLTAEQAEQDSTVIAEPTVVIGPSGAGERAWIDLHIDMSAFEGPENILSITLEGLPGRAELSAGADNGDGTWTVPAGDVEGLRFRPPAGRAADYKLAVSATSFEPATGEVALARPLEQTVTVHVDAQGAPLDGSAEDGEAPEPDAEETLSGGDTVTVDLAIDASAFHTDGSEQTTFTISGVPKGGRLSAGLDNGDGSWTLEPGDREGLRMILPAGSPRLSSPGLSLPGLSLPGLSLDVEGRALHIDLDGYAVASGDETGDPTPNGGTEAEPSPIAADGEKDEVEHEDGEESEVEQDDDGLDHASPIIGIDADQVSEAGVADDIRGLPPITDNAAADPSTEVAATADVQIVLDDRGHAVQINVTVTVDVIFADTGEGGESHYVLVELPNGFTAPEGVEIVQGGGFVGLPDMTFIRVEIPAAVIVAGEGAVSVPVTLTALPDVAATDDFDFLVFAEIRDQAFVEAEADEDRVFTGVRVEAELPEIEGVTGLAAAVPDPDAAAILLEIDVTALDGDGTDVTSIRISGVPDGARLSAGVDNGDGSWTLGREDLEGLTITPPDVPDLEFDLTVTASTEEVATGKVSEASVDRHVAVLDDADGPDPQTTDEQDEATLPPDSISDTISDIISDIAPGSDPDPHSGEATGEFRFAIDIDTGFDDLDESGRLSVTLAGVPDGARFDRGTDNGDGSWTFEDGHTADLVMTVPADTADFQLQVTATVRQTESGDKESRTLMLAVEVPKPESADTDAWLHDNLDGADDAGGDGGWFADQGGDLPLEGDPGRGRSAKGEHTPD